MPSMESDAMTAPEAAGDVRAIAQPVSAPLTRAAIFMIVTVKPGLDHRATVRSFCGDLPGFFRAVEFRDIEGSLSCVVGVGSEAWDRLFGPPRPKELHPFREIRAGGRHAVSTPGDLMFHIRAKRMDLCFEMATQIMARLGDAVSTVDEVHGFRYFDDLDGWNALSTEAQERIIGRTKLSDVELDDSIKPTSAHNALTTITENGKEFQIVRDNMPFGRAGSGEFGTYFIGYCRTPRVTEQMIENMFVGRPPGNYDRLLDFSRAVTGTLFFVPSATFLESVNDDPAAAIRDPQSTLEPAPPGPGAPDGSLAVGSLKGENRHE